MINESMARKFWPGANPIGKRFGQGNDRSKWFEVVGVLSDVRSFGLSRSAPTSSTKPSRNQPSAR
jgi:hypothetical protein